MNQRTLITSLTLFVLSTSIVHAEGNRFALVIGNGNYDESRLKNPENDAKLISQSLKKLGFEVETKIDLNQQSMEETISSFCQRLPKNSFAFFFFAGHGIQAKNSNYLIPVGATLNSESSLKYRTVALDFVRDELENSKSSLNVVVLDCCRDNPFERSWNRSMGQRGFAPIPEVPEGNIVAFATSHGKAASDGGGNNSPYTLELAAALNSRPKDGLTLVDGVFFTLGRAVKAKSKQRPHLYIDSTMPKYYLLEPSDQQPSPSEKPMATPRPSIASSAAETETTPAETEKPFDAKPSTESNELLAQAFRYHNEGEFDYAITAFTALITDPDVSRNVRNQARTGRGGSYLAQGTADSINRAIIDFKAAKQPGVQLSVTKTEAEMFDAKTKIGNVHRNEIVLLTQSKGDWFWVESVQGNPSRRGWVKCDAFLTSHKTVSSEPVRVVNSEPVNTSPAISSVDAIGPQPATTNPPSITAQPASTPASPTMISYGPDGKPIGVVPSRDLQSTAMIPQPTRVQPIAYGADGKPIYPSGTIPTDPNRSATVQTTPRNTTMNNTVYYDQYGRPMNVGAAPSPTQPQRAYSNQPTNNGQPYTRPSSQPMQRPTTPANRYTQPSNPSNNNYSNSGNLKSLNTQRRDFDREVARYQRENGPLSPAERREVNQWRVQNDRAKAKAFWGK